mmetsp:Transcript_15744/g.17480  ORF Transcript_15744/g.17480 Transcript_15744/m.17480 type:complete len:414 (+) Transcript_15744:52-1293(+)|eukprot:CAMPEP_0194131450 /NCGR_PEP_ID=MMETSP0152-20130528/2220_1 /TAXON_ID=1049557 /ORGANISM="Thalassiothrix antarctica, Strain L6-D1" /LENGTH=413 /DNA_ID=CAMNT_0038826233 /DNA_START=100 /DNA_END=1341 /DNA_ORIENTATION=-
METYQTRVDDAVRSKDWMGISEIFGDYNTVLGQGEQRALCGHFIKRCVSSGESLCLEAFDAPDMMNVFTLCLGNLPTFIENASDSTIRQQLFDYLVENKNEYSDAARILGGMRMDSDDLNSAYFKTPAETCDVYVKIAECFLEDDETVEADSAVTKAGTVVEQITEPDKHTALILRYKSTYARVLDANRKFLQAASRYHDLSNPNPATADLVDADDLLALLGRAATCAILAASGSQKQRVLALLAKDDRLSKLSTLPSYENHALLVNKLYRSQVIRPKDLEPLNLAEHQRAIRGDGLTILQHAIVEHNMISVSRLYRSIYIKELQSKFLGNVISNTEKFAANMIMEGSLQGEIDQVDGVLHFNQQQLEQDEDKEKEEIWDKSITSFCMDLNTVSENIKEANVLNEEANILNEQ